MNPILYKAGTTDFTNNGMGVLTDCIKCEVTEKRNGIYEAEFHYPINGVRYAEIQEGRIICVSHDDSGDVQPFIIYGRSASINGVVQFFCQHISYMLNDIVVSPFTATSVAGAFSAISANSMTTNPFTFTTDNTTSGNMALKVPAVVRSVLGGVEGSILDVFGGEYKYDKFTVYNLASRGVDSGVTIRYGKDLLDVTQTVEADGLYNSAVPYWSNGTDTVYGGVVVATGQTRGKTATLNLTDSFDEQPTVTQLQNTALAYLNANKPWIPRTNIKVDFIALWQTEEYKNFLPLTHVGLCDTVTVSYPELGVNSTAKIITVVWDALAERYTKMELGDARPSFSDTIKNIVSSQGFADVSSGLVNYDSKDAEPGSSGVWKTVDIFTSGKDLKTLFGLASAIAYNVRWLFLQVSALNKIGSETDLNTLTATGIYRTLGSGNQPSNMPTTLSYAFVYVIKSGIIHQYAVRPETPAFYIRSRSGSPATWSNWRNLY